MCPGVDPASKNEYQGFPMGMKAAGAWGWRPTTLVVPNVKKIRGLNLPGTPLGPLRPVVGVTFMYDTSPFEVRVYLDLPAYFEVRTVHFVQFII
jgi:hypothetical protein